MQTAKEGQTVRVHYVGMLKDGNIFDASINRDPLEFTLGKGDVIAGFEAAVIGMKEGENKTIVIPYSEAYGERDETAISEVDRTQMPPDFEPVPGQQLSASQPDGSSKIVTIIKIDDKTITVDGNHPLAGKDLVFDITLVKIV